MNSPERTFLPLLRVRNRNRIRVRARARFNRSSSTCDIRSKSIEPSQRVKQRKRDASKSETKQRYLKTTCPIGQCARSPQRQSRLLFRLCCDRFNHTLARLLARSEPGLEKAIYPFSFDGGLYSGARMMIEERERRRWHQRRPADLSTCTASHIRLVERSVYVGDELSLSVSLCLCLSLS